ncbi:uncharacterized protein LOC107828153 [Nicotiana tabacum]|uniref:Uncharacterized protein LOC107828153 n=2 Tax=Nicotiana TaxID=4085 RepID=A0A1S4DBU5_TOBAC|nr:PREDICTED: uncharacterized protein LOC104247231 [Nicotiana sylvestris]XP_016510902.1 PREDICTED: uncharacterized protein LOC107828153 [Nicotiana tabacum]
MIESVASWFTPAVLFCFLNLMIGTIFITSSRKTDTKKQHQQSTENSIPQLTRSPSLLQRVRSFNFSFPDPFSSVTHDFSVNSPQLDRSPSLLQRVRSINLSFSRLEKPGPIPSVAQHADPYEEEVQKVDNIEPQIESHVTRTKSATCVETPVKIPTRTMMKSASEKMAVAEKEEEADQVDWRRPATTRETASFGEDEAVDEKADDFINMFRQQLKLQRLDSIIRYKEMLNRGVGK